MKQGVSRGQSGCACSCPDHPSLPTGTSSWCNSETLIKQLEGQMGRRNLLCGRRLDLLFLDRSPSSG